MVQAPAATCVRHRRRHRVASCGICASALCSDCIVHTPVGIKCRRCSGVGGGGAADGAHLSAPVAPRREVRSRRTWVVLVGAAVAVAAVAGYRMLPDGPGTRDEPLLGVAPATAITERSSEFVGAGGMRIGGTLTLPGGRGGETSVPAVLIVPGLGAIDRNAATGVGSAGTGDTLRATLNAASSGNIQGPVDPVYQSMSKALADAGIASFRYDKRGTGATRLRPDQALSFEDEVTDARAALEFLGARQEIGSSALGVLGHDTGGLVAMRLAAANPRVKAAVFVSTPIRPLGDVLAEDFMRADGGPLVDQVRSAVSAVQATGRAPAPETLAPFVRELFPPGQERYLQALFSLDPTAEARAVGVAALVVRGGADRSTTTADGQRLVDALPGPAEVMVGANDADHNLAVAGEGHAHVNNGAAAGRPDNRDSGLTARISTWMRSRLGA